MCHGCHRYYTENPTEFTAWLLEYLGIGHMDMLLEKKNQLMKTNKQLRSEIAKHYRLEHRKMESDEHYSPVSFN
jgi:hypothetical protein